MPTRGAEGASGNGGVGAAAKRVADSARNLVGLELELAALELKGKAGRIGLGAGLLVTAAVLGVFGLGFLFATIAAALAEVLATWLALLLVTAFLFLLAGVLVAVGIGRVRSGTPPVPEQAIAEAKLTTQAIRR